MNTRGALTGWLRQAVAGLLARHRGEPSPREFRQILARWQIDRFTIRARLPGSSAAAWLVDTPQTSYVLRRAGDDRRYLEFQVFAMQALAGQEFPCRVPELLGAGGRPWHAWRDHYWVVYPFIPGDTVGLTLSVDQASQLGELVARFHELSATWDIRPFRGQFTLPLFEAQTMQAPTHWSRLNTASAARRLLHDNRDVVRRACDAIVAADLSSLTQLQTIAIHYDWQGGNLLTEGTRLSAVLDFDSLVEAPRLVDFLNALFYAGSAAGAVDTTRLEAFVEGYAAVSPLSPAELALACPCAVDRLLWLIASILAEQERRGDPRLKDDLLLRLVQALLWLVHHRREFGETLVRINASFGR